MGFRDWSKGKRRVWLLFSIAIALGFGAALFIENFFFQRPQSNKTCSRMHDSISVREATTREVHLYFANRKGRYLQAEQRKLEAKDTSSAIEVIIRTLIDGPDSSDLVSAIPAGSQLLHTFVTPEGTGYLDFSLELSRLHPGGVTAERLTLYAIVNSIVLNFEEVERVHLLLEGKPASTLSGHLDIRHPKTANLLIVR
jgi:spore germination protein GerM